MNIFTLSQQEVFSLFHAPTHLSICLLVWTNITILAKDLRYLPKLLWIDASYHKAGPWFNIKMSSYQYRKSHCGDKTVVRSSYLHNGISYTGKMTSLYSIGAQIPM